jgi:DNA adenine methylase|tara:strand:+ start:632 stop:1525 length:894 start_codon:yes stop_codon:yes gene_type:complete
MKTPIRYAGGKSKAYNIITQSIPAFPYPKKIISPFMGGGSLESRWSSELSIPVIGFDIFDPLVNFWNVLLNDSDALADKLETLEPTKESYAEVKEKLLCWSTTQEMLKDWPTDYYKRDAIELSNLDSAAYYFYNHNLSYGPMYLGWISKIYENKEKWIAKIKRIREYKNPNLSVNLGSFSDVIPEYQNDFLYLDPPYYLEKDLDNKMFKGIYPNPNIDVHHTGFDHELLRDLLHNHPGKFVLSYNNCETIREYYKDFDLQYPSWHYSYGAGETRVGKTKKDIGNELKKSHEILIVKA